MKRPAVLLLMLLVAGAVSGPAVAQTVSGDFDGDGFADLAIGVPHQDIVDMAITLGDAGAVYVVYGDATGFTGDNLQQFWHQGVAGIDDAPEAGDQFGATLGSGDFNGDGYADLAVGVTFEDVGAVNAAGAVQVIYGSSAGLTATGDQFWTQNSTDIEDSAETFDLFGVALAAANFGRSSHADLAVGSLDSVGALAEAGAVNVIYGTSTGLSAGSDQLWHENVTGIGGEASTGDGFGRSLAAANFGKSGHADLAVGVYGENFYGALADGGAVTVIYGTATGLSASGDQQWHQDRAGIADAVEDGDEFGWALAAANFGKSRYADLAVGARTEDIGVVDRAGAVNVIYGTARGLSATGDQFWHQNSRGIVDLAEPVDFFAVTLAAANFGKSSHADLAVGVPFEDVGGVSGAGAVNVIYGGSSGLSANGDQFWHQDVAGIEDIAESPDSFSNNGGLGAGNFGSSTHADLVVGTLQEDVGAIVDAGAVNVIYGTSAGLSAFGDDVLYESFFSGGVVQSGDNFGAALSPRR